MATGVATASRGLAAEVIREVLSEHEQRLLSMATKGKSLDGLAKLYRQYDGPNGVQDALDKIKAKIEERLQQRVGGEDGEPMLEERVAGFFPEEDEDRGLGGVPIRSAPRGSMAGAGAGSASTRVEATPPKAPAPAPSSLGLQSTGFNGNGGAPAVNGRVQASRQEGRDRRAKALALLGVQRMSTKALAAAMDMERENLKALLQRLEGQGLVVRTTANAYDWPDAKRGRARPSRVWKLVDEPEGCLPASNVASHSSTEVTTKHVESEPDAPPERLGAAARASSPGLRERIQGAVERGHAAASNGVSVQEPKIRTDERPEFPTELGGERPADGGRDRAAYIDLLWRCAELNPAAAHIFDRLETLLGIGV